MIVGIINTDSYTNMIFFIFLTQLFTLSFVQFYTQLYTYIPKVPRVSLVDPFDLN